MSDNLVDLAKIRRQREAEAWAMPEREAPDRETRDYKGQRYTLTGSFQRRRKDGTLATILEWTSPCAQCGEPFTITTPAASRRFQPNRRCQKHKRPGHRVKGGGNA